MVVAARRGLSGSLHSQHGVGFGFTRSFSCAPQRPRRRVTPRGTATSRRGGGSGKAWLACGRVGVGWRAAGGGHGEASL
jgi:hypothetical protein